MCNVGPLYKMLYSISLKDYGWMRPGCRLGMVCHELVTDRRRPRKGAF